MTEKQGVTLSGIALSTRLLWDTAQRWPKDRGGMPKQAVLAPDLLPCCWWTINFSNALYELEGL